MADETLSLRQLIERRQYIALSPVFADLSRLMLLAGERGDALLRVFLTAAKATTERIFLRYGRALT